MSNERETQLEDTIYYMVHSLLIHADQWMSTVNECKNLGLTLNQLEAEGFMRVCYTIKHEFLYISEYLAKIVKQVEKDNEKGEGG